MIKVILFDLGGVVFKDFFSGGETGLAKALGLSSKTILTAYVKTDAPAYCKNELTDENRWKDFVKEVGLSEAKIQICIDEYYKSYQLLPETLTFLEHLKKDNNYKLGVLSDQPIGIANYLREEYPNVFSLFDPTLAIISAEVGLSKKDSNFKIYKLAIEKSQVYPNEILFVDDSMHNIQKAKSVGMKTYYFDIENQPISKLLKGLKEKL